MLVQNRELQQLKGPQPHLAETLTCRISPRAALLGRCQGLGSLLLPLPCASGTRPLAPSRTPPQCRVSQSVRPGEQSRGPEALDPWGPGKYMISPGWVVDSRAVLQQDSLSYGVRPLGSPSSLIRLCALGVLCVQAVSRPRHSFLPLELPCLFEVFIYLLHGSWEHEAQGMG